MGRSGNAQEAGKLDAVVLRVVSAEHMPAMSFS